MILRSLTFMLFAFCFHAYAYTYSQGTATLTKPVQLRGDAGELLTLNSGPVGVEIESYGVAWGNGSLVIITPAGRAKITIPRDTFQSSWIFMTPAARARQDFALSGRDSTRVDKDAEREDIVDCDVPATEVPILSEDGRPFMVNTRDASGRNVTTQLRIRVCAQVVSGRVDIQQLTNGAGASCRGRQRVLRQLEKTTQLYTVDILDPATSQSVGKIEVSNPEKVSSNDRIVRRMTACVR